MSEKQYKVGLGGDEPEGPAETPTEAEVAAERAAWDQETAVQAEVARSRESRPFERAPKEIMDDRHAQRMLEDSEYAAEMHQRVGQGGIVKSVDPVTGKEVYPRRFESYAPQNPSEALVAEDARIEANRAETPSEQAARTEAERVAKLNWEQTPGAKAAEVQQEADTRQDTEAIRVEDQREEDIENTFQ